MTRNVNASAPELADAQETQTDDYQFDVFLSYSRKDEEFGKKLEQALENFRLPKNIKTSLISRNRLSVFRDKNDLVPTDTDYYQTIAGYLKRSGNLIVICSPNARRSQYVNQEIAAFLESHEPKSIIPILLSGRPNNDSEAHPDEHAFPEALCSALKMPLALDFTEFEPRSKVHRGRYRDSWYTLLAKIFGAERAEIERVDAKRQARRRAIFAAVSFAIIAMLSVALVLAVISRREAVKQKQAAVKERDRARRLLYASDINLAQSAFESDNAGLGRGRLESYLPANQLGQEDLRGFEWYYLWRLYHRELATFKGTDDIVFSRDGSFFATATADALKIWDAASLRETASIKLDAPRDYLSIDLSPDGRTLAYGNFEGVTLLDISSGSSRELPRPGKKWGQGKIQDREELPGEEYWTSFQGGAPRFSPDGKLLAISYDCGFVAVYDVHSLKQIIRLSDEPLPAKCSSFVVFSPDSRFLAYGKAFVVGLWDTVTARDFGSLGGEEDAEANAAAFSPDGEILAIGDKERQVVLWNTSTRKVLTRLKGHNAPVSAVAFSPDGKTLYSGSQDQTVKLWDFNSYKGDGRVDGAKIEVFATISTGYVASISYSRVGRFVATADLGRNVKLWDITSVRAFDAFEDVAVVSPGANIIAKSLQDSTEAALFDLQGDPSAKLWTVNQREITVSPDGKIFAAVSNDGSDGEASTIRLWDVSSRQELVTLRAMVNLRATFRDHAYGPQRPFSSDGRLFTAIGSDGNSVIRWNTAERKELTPIRNDSALTDYRLSSNGKVIVTMDTDGRRVKSWDVTSQRQLAVIELKAKLNNSGRATPLALSPDGKFLAFSDSENVMLWETSSTQQPILIGKHEKDVSVLAFSADGKLVAAGDETGVVKVWEADTRKALSTFTAHKDGVMALAFSPNGKTLASGGGEGTVKLYGIASMRELIALTHTPSPVKFVAGPFRETEDYIEELFFSPDGRSLITLSGNQVLRIWRGASDADVSATAR